MRRILLIVVSALAYAACSEDATIVADGGADAGGDAASIDAAAPSDAKLDTGVPVSSGKACVPTCKVAGDCPTPTAGVAWTCENDLCRQVRCQSDADCKVAELPHCIQTTFARQCVPPACTGPGDCSKTCSLVSPGYKGCSDFKTSCTKSDECKEPDFPPGHTQCQDEYCGCVSDQGCQDTKGVLLGGTWKCVAWSPTWTRLP